MENPYNSTEQVLDWIREQNRKIEVNVRQISFKEMEPMWQFDAEGNLRHATGKFFSIEGIRVKTNYGNVAEWEQPIINQPEIGYLGIITKEIDGVLYFLLQAEPFMLPPSLVPMRLILPVGKAMHQILQQQIFLLISSQYLLMWQNHGV